MQCSLFCVSSLNSLNKSSSSDLRQFCTGWEQVGRGVARLLVDVIGRQVLSIWAVLMWIGWSQETERISCWSLCRPEMVLLCRSCWGFWTRVVLAAP